MTAFGPFGEPLQNIINAYAYGDVWSRDALPLATKYIYRELARQIVSFFEKKKSPVDVANEHGMHAWPLEIFTGLVYLSYTDDPDKEMHNSVADPNHAQNSDAFATRLHLHGIH